MVMSSSFYIPILGFIILVYLATLFLLNRIPNCSVKSIGWFTIKHITIDLNTTKVYIRRIHFRLNLFRGKESVSKLFNIELHGIDIKCHKKSGDHNSKDEQLKVSDMLSFNIPKRMYDLSLHTRIINQLNIHLFNCSVYHEETYAQSSIFLDHVGFECYSSYEDRSRLVVNMLNGYLQNVDGAKNDDQIKLFRYIELCISYDIVLNCKVNNQNNLLLKLTNFGVSLSLGGLSISLDKLSVPPRSQEPAGSKRRRDISGLRDILDTFTLGELRLEDFSLSHRDMKLNISTFSSSIANENHLHIHDLNLIKLHMYLTSSKIFHKGSKCFELPSAAFNFSSNPLEIINTLTDTNLSMEEKTEFFNLESSLTLTNPIFDIFYDQLDILLPLTRSTKSKNKDKVNYFYILNNVREISNKITIVDIEVNVHLPKFDNQLKSKFHRDSLSNVIVTFNLSTVFHKFSTRNFNVLLNKNFKGSKKHGINGLFKLKNFKFNAEGNLIQLSKINCLCTYNAIDNTMSIKLRSKNIMMKSINKDIFYMVRELRNRNIIVDNRMFATLSNLEKQKVQPKSKDTEGSEKYLELFQLLPSFISAIKLNISNIQADVICKDGLPSHIIYDEKLGKNIDLNDFGRGVSIRFSDMGFNYKKSKKEINLTIKTVQCFTLSEHSTEYIADFDQITEYQVSDSEFSDTTSINSNETEDEKSSFGSRKIKKVLNARDISFNNSIKDFNKLNLYIPEIDGRFDMFLCWCTIYAQTLIKIFAPTVQRTCSKQEISELSGKNKKLNIDVIIDSIAIVTRLPTNVDVLFEIDTLELSNVLVSETVKVKYVRLYVVHPVTKLWARLLTIRDSIFCYRVANVEDYAKFEIKSNSIRFNIPHQFLFYTVIDNIITFVKAIKQIKYNFNNLSLNINDFKRLLPEAKPAIQFPYINLKTQKFGITLENDAFENEIAYIYELGAIEQKERLRKMKLFNEKIKEIKAITQPSIEVQAQLTNTSPNQGKLGSSQSSAPKYASPLRHVLSETNNNGIHTHLLKDKIFNKHKKPKPLFSKENLAIPTLLTEEEAEEKIKLAREMLDKSFSISWIRKFRKFRQSRVRTWRERSTRAWGDESVNPIMTEKFNILNYASGPHLMAGLFKDVDIVLDRARIPDVDQFLYEYGKKQPKLDYSILIPLFIELRSRSLYVALRDYTLPLISFPENHDLNKSTINFSGNIVINEKLVTRKEEMRYIFVPFSPAAPSGDFVDNFYSVFIPRTLTPVKFMFNLKCDLNTERACMVTWCKSYQSALSAATSAFDNFTKPAVDDSPLGWWDKVALLAHGKLKFEIANELCLHIKGSANPYEMVGKASGFVFCWKNNVNLRINYSGRNEELVILESDDFLLAIPNYSEQERKSWSFFYDALNEYVPDIESEAKKFQKRVVKLSSSDRVRWTIGLLFERNKSGSANLSDNEERTSTFRPHYDVFVTSPHFEWHPDSYKHYRSDYLHLSISVISKSLTGNCYNAAYLTPLTFHYFFHWWNLLTDHVSLPIKHGSLFRNTSSDISHVKMGSHLFTVKYQLIFEPLIISHIYMHSTSEFFDHQDRIAFTGLKGKFAKCSIDLHQRKELVTYINEKLDINNKILHLRMNHGEISVDEADIRFINAVFNDISIRGNLISYLTGINNTSSPSTFSYAEKDKAFNITVNNVDILDSDLSWVDLDDFVELEVRETLSSYPKIKILPFFSTPRFAYFREFTFQKDGPFPFGNEKSHDCVMGLQKPEDTQACLLSERMKTIDDELKSNEENLRKLEASNNPKYEQEIERLKTEIVMGHEKLDVVESVWEKFSGESFSSNSSMHSSVLNKVTSKQLSVYSSHKTSDEIKEISNLHSSVTGFHNRFIIHNLQLKWDNDIRDLFMEYIQKVSERKSNVFLMSKKAVDLVQKVINASTDEEGHIDTEESVSNEEFKCVQDVIDCFNDQINKVDSDNQEIDNKYLIKLIHPQIQLASQKDLDSCVLITSRDLEMRIVSVNIKGMNEIISESAEVSSLIETRYGVLFDDSHVFVFKKDVNAVTHPVIPSDGSYSDSNVTWTPWLGCEVCYDSSWVQDQLVIERNTMALMFKKPNSLFVENKSIPQSNEIMVNLSKVVINATSEQYSTIYYVITDLLVHGKTVTDELVNRLDKIMSLSDHRDFEGLDIRVRELQYAIREHKDLILKLDSKEASTTLEKELLSDLEMELERMNLELSVLMGGLGLRSSKSESHKKDSRVWNILADQVIWHLLDSRCEPFVDFALAKSKFTRVDSFDGSNVNKVEVSMIQGFNLQDKAIYPELLIPYLKSKEISKVRVDSGELDDVPIILMTWKMLDAIAGIPIMKQAKLTVQPLKVQLDYETTKELFEYLFPNEEHKVEQDHESESRRENEMTFESEEGSIVESHASSDKILKNRFKAFISKHKTSNARSNITENSDMESAGTSSRRSDSSSARFSSSEDISLASDPKQKYSSKVMPKKKNNEQEEEDDISLIIKRSSKYISIVDIEVSKVNMLVSFKAPKHLNILDVHNLGLTIPNLRYRNKMWSGEDFFLRLRKDIIKIILNHTGKILGNKFKYKKRKIISEPLKQISNYASFMTIQDLQSEGRSRDTGRSRDAAKADNHPYIRQPHHHNHQHHTNSKTPTKSPSPVAFERILKEVTDDEELEDPEESPAESNSELSQHKF